MRAWFLGGSSGLGLELAREARRLKMTTSVWGRGIGNSSNNHLDLADRSSVDAFCAFIRKADPVFIQELNFFVWNAGILDYRLFGAGSDIEQSLKINVIHPTLIIRELIARKVNLDSTIHLLVISSVASWRARKKMAVYAGAKSYQAQFARALALDLEKIHLGSKVTIAMPAGIRTGIFNKTVVDTSGFMPPKKVARLVWRETLRQDKLCDWFNVISGKSGNPIVSREKFTPELAYDELPLYNRASS